MRTERRDRIGTVGAVLGIFALAALAVGCSKNRADELPVLGQVSDFSLVDQDGRIFDRQALQGSVWITDFIFTHCRSTCPRLTAQMKELQARLSDVPGVHFLSVTVDPRNDTPPVLKAYMVKNELDQASWRFVTGEEQAIEDFVVGSFKVGYGKTQWSTELTHSTSFALVDTAGRIRGYYDSEDEGLGQLEKDARALAR